MPAFNNPSSDRNGAEEGSLCCARGPMCFYQKNATEAQCPARTPLSLLINAALLCARDKVGTPAYTGSRPSGPPPPPQASPIHSFPCSHLDPLLLFFSSSSFSLLSFPHIHPPPYTTTTTTRQDGRPAEPAAAKAAQGALTRPSRKAQQEG